MKVLLPLLALALMLAGCTTPTESDDGDDGGNVTSDQVGGQVSGDVVAVDPGAGSNSSTNSTPSNATG